MKKYICTFSILLLCILTFTGCGKKQEDKTTELVDQEHPPVENTSVDSETNSEPEVSMDESGFYPVKDYVITTEMTVNVRVNPSTDAPIYKLLEEGTVLKRNGYNDQWSRVVLDNTDFYVATAYIEETEPPEGAEPETDETSENGEEKTVVKKIVIDPANQADDNVAKEQIGPDSEETKNGASTGSVGAGYGTKEYEINLVYATLLKTELESRGYEVILTRDTNNVDMTNKERAIFANESGAGILIRIQMNYSINDDMTGVMALTMSNNSIYNSQLYGESNALATRILQGITEDIETTNHGIYESEDMTLINWSEIPVAVIGIGFLSNSTEEENLLSEGYQSTMVKAIADGIDYYFAN